MRSLASTLAALLLPLLVPALATAQPAADPQRLPATAGRVAQFSLTPNGDVDGLILQDGTEIHTPPHLGPSLLEAVRPGDAIIAHGLQARAIRMMDAVSVTDVASGRTVTDTGAPAPPVPPKPPRDAPFELATVSGTIRMQLHGPKGDVNGVLLDDGTIVRLPPGDASNHPDQLQPGLPLSVRGHAITVPAGRVVAADRIGLDTTRPQHRRDPAPPNGGPHP